MIEDKIVAIRDCCHSVDEKTCNRLSIEQFGDMLCIMSDKGLIEGKDANENVNQQIDDVFEVLQTIVSNNDFSRATIRPYNKAYNKLLLSVKESFDLEPKGSIQGRYMALGIAIGAGIGTALSTINPAMLSVGIGGGVAIGITIGKKKEAEAKEAGKLF